jgi:hypothetical protein
MPRLLRPKEPERKTSTEAWWQSVAGPAGQLATAPGTRLHGPSSVLAEGRAELIVEAAELVQHYAHALAVAPSTAVYCELLSARSFAGTLLGRSAPRQRPDLTVTAGWLPCVS